MFIYSCTLKIVIYRSYLWVLMSSVKKLAIKEVITEEIKCKGCGSPAVVKIGSYKDVQKYYCKVSVNVNLRQIMTYFT